MIAVALLFACIVAEVARELCFKRAAGSLDDALSTGNWVRALANRILWAGLAIWVAETLVWIVTLQRIPLSIAYPVTAASYAIIPVMGWFLFHERLGRSQMAGVVLVTTGAACVGIWGH